MDGYSKYSGSRITFLGTGTSSGVPQLGCSCEVCRSVDPRDRRMRCSSIVEINGARILVDCGPDFYWQMLHREFVPFDAVLITHEHYDHVAGLDDLRPLSAESPENLYCNEATAKSLRARIPYCLKSVEFKNLPHLELHVVKPHHTFYIKHVPITPLRVMHGKNEILGFRIGDLVYITDMLSMPAGEMEYIRGAKMLVVNALRKKPHPTHQSIEQAIEFAESTGIRPVWFIHMSHDAGLHAETDACLPEGMHLAYDGLEVDF